MAVSDHPCSIFRESRNFQCEELWLEELELRNALDLELLLDSELEDSELEDLDTPERELELIELELELELLAWEPAGRYTVQNLSTTTPSWFVFLPLETTPHTGTSPYGDTAAFLSLPMSPAVAPVRRSLGTYAPGTYSVVSISYPAEHT